MNQGLVDKAFRNVLFNGIRLVITVCATLCTSAIIARTLGPDKMGLYSYAMWLVSALGILANLGLPATLAKYISEYLGRGDAVMAARLGRQLLLTQLAAAVCLSVLTGCFMFLKTPHRFVIGFAAVLLFFQAIQGGLSAALAGVQRFDTIAFITLYVAIVQVALVVFAASLHSGVIGMLWATLGGLALGTWLHYRAVYRSLLRLAGSSSQSSTDTPGISGRIRRFSLTLSYILFVDMIVYQKSEVLFLKWRSTLPEIAFYSLAYSIAGRISEVANTFGSTLLPLYSETFGRSGLRELSGVYLNALKFVQLIMAPLCAVGIVTARPVVQLIYGQEYQPLVPVSQILLATVALTSLGVASSPMIYGSEKQSFMAKFGSAVAVLNISLDFMLIPSHGAMGAAVANCVAQLAGLIGSLVYASRLVSARFPWRTTAIIYAAAFFAMAPAAYCSWIRTGAVVLGSSVVMGALIYLALLVATGEIGKHDLDVLKGALTRRLADSEHFEPGCSV